jgi:hypothetical protein
MRGAMRFAYDRTVASGGKRVRSIGFIAFALAAVEASAAATLDVPADYPTIQQAIDAATVGDTVLVAPGRYAERIVIDRDIVVASSAGALATTIDAERADTVVRFSGTTRAAVLQGFTVTGGHANEIPGGGGIYVNGAAASIVGNVIVDNEGGGFGNGISLLNSQALIFANFILANVDGIGSGGGGGGGIGIAGSGCADCGSDIVYNAIVGNRVDHYTDGGGILLDGAGPTTVIGNEIAFNAVPLEGGGISIFNDGRVHLENNLIIGNRADIGGGVYWLVPENVPGIELIGNTIADNVAVNGSAAFADGFDADGRISNNLMAGPAGATVLYCGDFGDPSPPRVSNNDVYAADGDAYGGLCADRSGVDGNISADPRFIAPGDYRLQRSSPGIDAGFNGWVTTATDFAQRTRISDDDGDGIATVDLGAYEFDPDPIFHDGFEPPDTIQDDARRVLERAGAGLASSMRPASASVSALMSMPPSIRATSSRRASP